MRHIHLLRYLARITGSITILLILVLPLCKAQQANYNFRTFNNFAPNSSESLLFRVENINFFKNNEYKSDNTEGYTLTGGVIAPHFVYYLNDKLRLSAGARLLKYSGQEKINKASLLLSAMYKPNNKLSIILGNINNNDNHSLPEYMASTERYYTENGESGLQFIFKSKTLEMDSWINWENFIERNDSLKEKFTLGLSSRLFLNSRDSDNTLSIPLYLTINHKGGEIDISEEPASTISNIAIGLEYEKRWENNFIKNLGTSLMFTKFKSHKGTYISHFNSGSAIYAKIGLNSRIGDFIAGYWHSKDYFSLHGLDIFHSVSSFDAQLYDKNRKLLNLKYIYRHDIGKDSSIVFSLEDYYDIDNSKNNISASVFLIINTNIFIKKL